MLPALVAQIGVGLMTNSSHTEQKLQGAPPLPFPAWEKLLVVLAVLAGLALGAAHLGAPSLWHDELVHVFVAKQMSVDGRPALPSGTFYPSAMAYNALLAGVIALFGYGAVAVRMPSVLLSALNLVLFYGIARRLAGRTVALTALFALALSPWHVAWARQARFYPLQATAYLIFLGAVWHALETSNRSQLLRNLAAALAAYLLGMLTAFHSLLFLAPVGVFSVIMAIHTRQFRSRWTVSVLACGALGVLTLAALKFNPNPADQQAVFDTGLGGRLVDPQRGARMFYFIWLNNNLSTGFLILALLGTVLLPLRQKAKGVFAALAFWAPVLALTFLVGYRRPRFMFFAFPFYTLLFSFGLVAVIQWMPRFRRSFAHGAAALVLFLFLCRLGLSAAALTRDSLDTASGAHITLARRHPQWKKPCAYVREHERGETILTTTALPVLYYAGRVDNWFPNRYQWMEGHESGLDGLGSLAELQDFLRAHPHGYYIAEWERFEKWKDQVTLPDLAAEVAWVRKHMTRVDEACSDDVTLYRWDFSEKGIP